MKSRTLGELMPGQSARLKGFSPQAQHEGAIVRRLMELGLIEGADVAVVHQAPFGGDPIAVRVRGSLIALRRAEANLLEVLS